MEDVYKVISVIELFIIIIFLVMPPIAYITMKFQNNSNNNKPARTKKPVILAVFPLSKASYPLNLRDDFLTFVTQIPTLHVIALMDTVTYTRLVTWVKRLVATKEKIRIFYIASHGTNLGIAFTDGLVDAKRLATLIALSKAELVILMVCDGYNIAHTMRRHGVKAVIYIDGKIGDEEAIELMKSLISGLADGLTLQQSLSFVKAEASNIVAYAKLRETTAHNYKFILEKNRGEEEL